MDIVDTTFSWASKSFGMIEQCPYVDDPVASLMLHLPASISGQDQGVEMIIDTFSSWEFSRKAGYQQPLVLAITGPTGVGKSETGFIVAEAILAAKSRIGTSRRHLPEGYLVLGGQDYSNTSDAFVGDMNGLPEVVRQLLSGSCNLLRHTSLTLVIGGIGSFNHTFAVCLIYCPVWLTHSVLFLSLSLSASCPSFLAFCLLSLTASSNKLAHNRSPAQMWWQWRHRL